jgi:flagellin
MTVINTNVAASITANALTKNERAMSQAMERLSTGQRINNAGDDAAGLAISSRMTSQINGLNMAVRNANDAISMVQTADGALVEVEAMLQRMRELTVQAASGTMSTTDKSALNTEFGALEDQIQEIAKNTEWNGTKLLDGTIGTNTAVSFHVGANASQTISVSFNDLNTDFNATNSNTVSTNTYGLLVGLGTAGIGSGTGGTGDLVDQVITGTSQGTTLGYLDNAITNINTQRANLGAAISRLEYASDNLANVSQNTSASRSQVLDADYASETTELARTQIIQQAATAMLSQANQQAQSVLALLK